MEEYGCCFFLSPVTDILATVPPNGVKFRTMVQIGPGQVFFPLGVDVPRGSPKSKIMAL